MVILDAQVQNAYATFVAMRTTFRCAVQYGYGESDFENHLTSLRGKIKAMHLTQLRELQELITRDLSGMRVTFTMESVLPLLLTELRLTRGALMHAIYSGDLASFDDVRNHAAIAFEIARQSGITSNHRALHARCAEW